MISSNKNSEEEEYNDDIFSTDKKTKRIESRKDMYEILVDISSDSITLTDLDGNFIMVNQSAVNLHGFLNKEDMLERNTFDLVAQVDKQRYVENVGNIIKTGCMKNTEYTLLRKDGSTFPAEFNASVVTEGRGKPIAILYIVRDITERKKMEKELFKNKKFESIGLLAEGIAHDFNNILTVISTNLYMTKMNLKKESEPYQSIMEAEKAVFRASSLTNQLLAFTKGEAPLKECQSINEVIEEATGFALAGSNVECKIDIAENIWPLEIDRGQIYQVIHNLIVNADQSMPDGGKIIVKAVNYSINNTVPLDTQSSLPLKPGNYVKILISEESVSIKTEDIEKTCDPCFITKKESAGIGLTICYSIVKEHNGLLYARSKPGEGTVFFLYLPVSDKIPVEPKQKITSTLSGTENILVLDDDETVGAALCNILKCLGYTFEFVKNSMDAIKKYKQTFQQGKPFDAVIMDLTMPGEIDGKECLQFLLEIDPEVKAIACSGYSNNCVIKNYKQYGFKNAVTKPYRIQDIGLCLKEVLSYK